MRPLAKTSTVSQTAMRSSWSMLAHTTAVPVSASAVRWVKICARDATSTPWTGSSRSSTVGARSSHLASTAFCWLPPLNVPSSRRGVGGLHADVVHQDGRVRDDAVLAQQAASDVATEVTEGDVVGGGGVQDGGLPGPVAGYQA